jgi:hypothetical protein
MTGDYWGGVKDRLTLWLQSAALGMPANLLAAQHIAEVARMYHEHQDSTGDVWLLCEVCDDTGEWELWPPGPGEGLASRTPADVGAGTRDWSAPAGDRLAWIGPWVEQVTNRRVVEVVEGAARVGPGETFIGYAIYVRIGGEPA